MRTGVYEALRVPELPVHFERVAVLDDAHDTVVGRSKQEIPCGMLAAQASKPASIPRE